MTTQVLEKSKTVEEGVTFPKLTGWDRCEATAVKMKDDGHLGTGLCDAQAFVRVVFPVRGEATHSGNVDLVFCNHHYVEIEKTGAFVSAEVLSQAHEINAKPTDPSKSQGF